jgi:hypothetical protein
LLKLRFEPKHGGGGLREKNEANSRKGEETAFFTKRIGIYARLRFKAKLERGWVLEKRTQPAACGACEKTNPIFNLKRAYRRNSGVAEGRDPFWTEDASRQPLVQT